MNTPQPTLPLHARSRSVSAAEAENVNHSDKDMSMSRGESPKCIHHEQPPCPATGRDAYETFQKCMDKHLFPMVSLDLMTEEDGLKTIGNELDTMLKDEDALLSMVEKRLMHATDAVRAAHKEMSNLRADAARDADNLRGARNT